MSWSARGLMVVVPTVTMSCGPIADEISLTNIVAMPLAFVIASLLLSWARRLWDRQTLEPGRARVERLGQGFGCLVFVGLALPASTSSSFEDDAIVAVALVLAASISCATLFLVWLSLPEDPRAEPGPRGAWTALAVCVAFELLFVGIWLLDGEAAQGLARLVILLEGSGAALSLVLVPWLLISAANGGRSRALDEELDDDPDEQP